MSGRVTLAAGVTISLGRDAHTGLLLKCYPSLQKAYQALFRLLHACCQGMNDYWNPSKGGQAQVTHHLHCARPRAKIGWQSSVVIWVLWQRTDQQGRLLIQFPALPQDCDCTWTYIKHEHMPLVREVMM